MRENAGRCGNWCGNHADIPKAKRIKTFSILVEKDKINIFSFGNGEYWGEKNIFK